MAPNSQASIKLASMIYMQSLTILRAPKVYAMKIHNELDFNGFEDKRAKIYKLNDEGNWIDNGIGNVSIEFLEHREGISLMVTDEKDSSTLLAHRISREDIYHKTDGTIISWRDPEIATDLALSFQDPLCCSYIWDRVCDARRSIHLPSVGAMDVGPQAIDEILEIPGPMRDNDGLPDESLKLPDVSISSVEQILKIFEDTSASSLGKDHLASLIAKDPTFIAKLCKLFTHCENMGTTAPLYILFKIIKYIIALNDSNVYEIMFSDKHIMEVVGMLEYDRDITCREQHRLFLREQAIFKEVVPIPTASVTEKIHQTYRLTYIKEVMLPCILDSFSFTNINAIILNNNIVVMKALAENSEFIKRLFEELKFSTCSEGKRKDMIRFLEEFCNLSRSLQLPLRVKFFSCSVQEGLFDIVTELLSSSEETLRLIGADILIVVLNNESSAVHNFLMHQSEQTLLSLLVTGMLSPCGAGESSQLLEVLRMLLDCNVTDPVPPEKSPFLEVFYGKYMDQIMETLSSYMILESKNGLNVPSQTSSISETLLNICELLSFCVQHHTFRIKYYVMRNKVIERVLQLTNRREKYLVVAAVRFLKACIGAKDEFYYRYIVKHDLFEPVVQAFLLNRGRYNLLDSAVLDLFNTILVDDAKTLLHYVKEKYFDKLKKIDYVDIFGEMKIKLDQGMVMEQQQSTTVADEAKVTLRHNRVAAICGKSVSKIGRVVDKDGKDADEDDSAAVPRTNSTGKPAHAVVMHARVSSGTWGCVDHEDMEEDTLQENNVKELTMEIANVKTDRDASKRQKVEDAMCKKLPESVESSMSPERG